MFKFVVLLFTTLYSVHVRAQADPYEVCVGYEDNTLIGFGQELSCTRYFACENEIGYEEDCAELYGEEFQFNYETFQCDYDDVVLCGADNPVNPTQPIETNPPQDTTTQVTVTTDSSVVGVQCPTNRPGEIIFIPSANCSEYFVCANGVGMRMVCMEGFTWNAEENQCDYPIFSRCSSDIEDDGLTVRCTRNGFYSTAYPRDCNRFVFCSAGIPLVQNCPIGHAWHIDRCIERQFASCPDLRRLRSNII